MNSFQKSLTSIILVEVSILLPLVALFWVYKEVKVNNSNLFDRITKECIVKQDFYTPEPEIDGKINYENLYNKSHGYKDTTDPKVKKEFRDCIERYSSLGLWNTKKAYFKFWNIKE